MMCAVKNSAWAAWLHDVCSGLQGTSRFQGVHFLGENWALLLAGYPRIMSLNSGRNLQAIFYPRLTQIILQKFQAILKCAFKDTLCKAYFKGWRTEYYNHSNNVVQCKLVRCQYTVNAFFRVGTIF